MVPRRMPTAPTQPHSSLSFMPAALTGKDMWGATPLDQLLCRIELRCMGYGGPYTPPSARRTLVYPGNLGVFNWGGMLDKYPRAYAVTTGRKLWQSLLPAGGQANPMTYRIHGKQMIVVAAGGHGSFGTILGDTVLAYALK
jgi:glucose dehydrogenase